MKDHLRNLVTQAQGEASRCWPHELGMRDHPGLDCQLEFSGTAYFSKAFILTEK